MIAFIKEPVPITHAEGLTPKEVIAIEASFKKMLNLGHPVPDILLMTPEMFQTLWVNAPLGALTQEPPMIAGIPFEVFDTIEQCKLRAHVLQSQGKLPMIAFGFAY